MLRFGIYRFSDIRVMRIEIFNLIFNLILNSKITFMALALAW